MVNGYFFGNGITDLAVAEGNSIVVLPGLGDGSFGNPITTTLSSDSSAITALYTADFNNDGTTDLVAVQADAAITVLLGNGDGTFTINLFSQSHGIGSTMVAVGDFNDDGKADLAIGVPCEDGTGSLEIFIGNGDGTFAATPISQAIYSNSNPGTFSGLLAVGDFNGDGQLDITSTSGTVLFGNGNGTFAQQGDRTPAPGGTLQIAVADLNGDGYQDLIEATNQFGVGDEAVQGIIRVSYFNPSEDNFSTPVAVTTPNLAFGITVGDFNGDGHWDVAVNNKNSVDILLNTGVNGALAVGEQISLPIAAAFPTAFVTVGDFNGDGRVDLAVATAGGTSNEDISILPGRGDGIFQATTLPPLGLDPVATATGDFNNDGRTDLATVNLNSFDLVVSLSQGDGTFEQEAYTLPASVGGGTRPRSWPVTSTATGGPTWPSTISLATLPARPALGWGKSKFSWV